MIQLLGKHTEVKPGPPLACLLPGGPPFALPRGIVLVGDPTSGRGLQTVRRRGYLVGRSCHQADRLH